MKISDFLDEYDEPISQRSENFASILAKSVPRDDAGEVDYQKCGRLTASYLTAVAKNNFDCILEDSDAFNFIFNLGREISSVVAKNKNPLVKVALATIMQSELPGKVLEFVGGLKCQKER